MSADGGLERYLVVCLGGAFGSGARYWMSTVVQSLAGPSFPAGTLAVNVFGSFLISAIMYVASETAMLSPLARLALTTGVMGGFTTYSAFAYDTFKYLQEGSYATAALDVGATVAVCLLACFAGAAVARAIVG